MKTSIQSLIFSTLLLSSTLAFAFDGTDITIHGLKTIYRINEIMNIEIDFPSFCGKNTFSVEDVESGDRIWERGIDIGCEKQDEFINRTFNQIITTEHARPGGTNITADPIITSREGTFRFVYESTEIRKVWEYQVFERIPPHLDSEAHFRLALLAAFYTAFPLILFREELKQKFRKKQ